MLPASKKCFDIACMFIVVTVIVYEATVYYMTKPVEIHKICKQREVPRYKPVIKATIRNNDKSRCLKNIFQDTVLVMNFNYPFYENKNILHELYDDVFGVILACGPPIKANSTGPGPDIEYKEENIWYFRYRCLTKAIQKYPGYNGKISFCYRML